jgi:DNA-binding response OmpR family regulator
MKKILVVDDEKDIVSTLKELLEMEGYEVATAYDVKVALLKFHEEKPDLVITDMMMPEISGLQLIKTIRSGSFHNNVPIILMSAMANFLKQEAEGWQVFIKKPTDIDIILDSIKKLLHD